jgi:hypothetical protein
MIFFLFKQQTGTKVLLTMKALDGNPPKDVAFFINKERLVNRQPIHQITTKKKVMMEKKERMATGVV